jgi:TetR/AcrR family transcriptional regulator, fatty acid metabolism regulator protein
MPAKAFASILEPRKADIVTAVLRLVDKVGITGLTTKRIAKEVGFAEGALYKHVRSKKDIFRLILDASARAIEELFQDMTRRRLDPEAALREWFGFAINFLEDYPGIYRVIFSDALYSEDKDLYLQFKSCLFDLRNRVQRVIEKGIDARVFWPDLDPARNALLYLGIIQTIFTYWTVFEGRARSIKETAKPYCEEYLRALRIPARDVRRG